MKFSINHLQMIFLAALLTFSSTNILEAQSSFKAQQLKYGRVKNAYLEKEKNLKKELKTKNLNIEELQIFIRGLKQEKKLEVWAKNKNDKTYQLFKTYDFCVLSGELGPKRFEGDGQVPEGFYSISVFNPTSSYHLSLGLDYPNKADKIKAGNKRTGGLIFIHGDCVSIGCIPITNDKIKELYILAVEAYNNGQKNIPVHIFPTNLSDEKFEVLKKIYVNNTELIQFWNTLKPGFDYFENKHLLPLVKITKDGNYSL